MKAIKKIVCVLLTLPMLLSAGTSALAVSEKEITAPSAVLIEASTKKILFEKNRNEVRACASITKVMTLLLVMEALDSGKITLDETAAASAHAASMGGSDIWLKEGEQMSVNDLIKATVVASANDAAVVLAELVSGSEESFVADMNKKAKELGMKNTVFKNCNGLDEDGHVTSAYDVALMSAELIRHEKIYDYTSIWLDYLRDGKTQIVNTNKLLKSYKGITGLKTGTTSQAGSCISATAKRDGLSLIAVVLGSSSGANRFSDASALLDYGFANFSTVTVKPPEELLAELPVSKGMIGTVGIRCKADGNFLCEKGKQGSLKYEIKYNKNIEAPIKPGQKLGEVIYSLDNKNVATYSIEATEYVEEITFKSVFSLLLRVLCTC